MNEITGVLYLAFHLFYMKVHFISVGGAVMHNLALALHQKGYLVTGSDDEIYEPAKSRLATYHLLPEKMGWFPEKITSDLDAVILGMHARSDNPELLRARELGLKIFSFPEFMYEQTRSKKRIVVGGSHGKTSTTAMIMFALRFNQVKFDYLVGSMIEGFDTMVGLSDDSELAVFEGDEYLTSPIDPRPKFHVYHADIGIITGIAWDHINVFPTFELYLNQFKIFIESLPAEGTLIYCEADAGVKKLVDHTAVGAHKIPYTTPRNHVEHGVMMMDLPHESVPLKVFGTHNLQNMMAAKYACLEAGITEEQFYQAMKQFKGTAKRLELLKESPNSAVYRDFAHAPSKLKATIQAARELYPRRKLIAAYELHTYSSLNREFLPQYRDSMEQADVRAVFFSPHALAMKKMPELDRLEVAAHFGQGVEVFTDQLELRAFLLKHYTGNENVLLMSSGTFDGMDTSF